MGEVITLTFDLNSAELFSLGHKMAPGDDEAEERVKLRAGLLGNIFKHYLAAGRALVAIQLVTDGKVVLDLDEMVPCEAMVSYAWARAWEVKAPPELKRGETREVPGPPGVTIWGLFTTGEMKEALAAAREET